MKSRKVPEIRPLETLHAFGRPYTPMTITNCLKRAQEMEEEAGGLRRAALAAQVELYGGNN